jgi:hypothetical protein
MHGSDFKGKHAQSLSFQLSIVNASFVDREPQILSHNSIELNNKVMKSLQLSSTEE